jgi:HSP20 family protein
MTHSSVAEMLLQQSARPASGAIEVTEDTQGYTVKMVVPGIAPEEIELTLVGRTLQVKADATAEAQPADVRKHVREYAVSRVARRIEFPLPVDADAVTAHGANGILTIRVPKSAAAQPKKISISTAPQIAAE